MKNILKSVVPAVGLKNYVIVNVMGVQLVKTNKNNNAFFLLLNLGT